MNLAGLLRRRAKDSSRVAPGTLEVSFVCSRCSRRIDKEESLKVLASMLDRELTCVGDLLLSSEGSLFKRPWISTKEIHLLLVLRQHRPPCKGSISPTLHDPTGMHAGAPCPRASR